MQIEFTKLGSGALVGNSLMERLVHPRVTGLLADCLSPLDHEGLLFYEPPWTSVVRHPCGELRQVGREPLDPSWETVARSAYTENQVQEARLPHCHLLALPVRAGEKIAGAICLSTARPTGPLCRSLLLAVARALGEMEARWQLDRRRGQLLSREQSARAQAETNERRLAFLYQATGAILSAPLDTATRLVTLARLCVPDLADWCLVDVLDGKSLRRLEVAHWNPAGSPLAGSLKGTTIPLPPGSMPWGPAELIQDVSAPDGPGDRELFGRLGARSAILLPLKSSKGPVGAMTFLFAESNRRYDSRDLALLSDLGQRAALAVDNAKLFEEAEKAIRARDETLAIVSHDLRNPLASILANAGMLERRLPDDELGDRLRPRAQAIRRSANRMNHMIRDLLDLARIEAGRLELHPGTQPIGPLLADALEMFQPLAAEKEISLSIPPIASGRELVFDRERILQVLSNLLGNALKFTAPGGSIHVVIREEEQGVAFGVIDDGCGIATDSLPHLFDRYWQGRPEERFQGAGLGLYIARGIVDAHRGRIWAESEPGKGSAFWFSLPFDPKAKAP